MIPFNESPRPSQLGTHNLRGWLADLEQVVVCLLLHYLEFLSLLTGARLALSDSGGIQLAASLLNLPCFPLRTTAEGPLTMVHGTDTLVHRDAVTINKLENQILAGGYKHANLPCYWNGQTVERIAEKLQTA